MIIRTFAKVKKSTLGTATFIASTNSSDRYGDIVDNSTWLLDSYKKNGVILLNHRQDMLPIGRAKDIKIVDGQLEVDVEFDLDDELGAEVARKVDRGFMSAVSVGFQPRKQIARAELPVEHPAYTKGAGMYFQENELLEVSVVTIPANADAVAKGITLSDLQIKRMVNQMIKTELFAMEEKALTRLRHIIAIEETEDTYTVTYAKAKEEVEELEEPEEVEEVEEVEEQLLSMDEEEEEKEKYHDDDEDEDKKNKNLLIYLLTK